MPTGRGPELQARSSSWSLSVPTQELRAAEHDATVSGRRLLLVGGEAAALLVAFAVLAAGALRRDLASARRRLTWHGARRWQRVLLTATESVAIGLGGAAVGLGDRVRRRGGGGESRRSARRRVLGESVLSPGGLLLGLAVALLAALVIAVTVSLEIRGRGRIGPLEIAAAAAVVAVLGRPRERLRRRGRAGRGGAAPAVLLLLPGLVAFAAAVVASRFLPGAGRLFARRGARDVRLAGVSVARSPGAAGVAAAFLALAVGLAVLAVAYRSTLQTGEHDQAAYACRRTCRTGGPARPRSRDPRRAAVALQRDSRGRGGIPGPPQLGERGAGGVGLRRHRAGGAGPAIRAMPLWRGDWGTSKEGLADGGCAERVDRAPGRHARRGDDASRRRPRPRVVPRDDRTARRLVPARGARPCDGDRPSVLSVALPAEARGGRLVSIALVPPRIIERGSDEGVALAGRRPCGSSMRRSRAGSATAA
jgi:hypothetical protein